MKPKIMRIALTALLLAAAAAIEHQAVLPLWAVLAVYAVPYLLISYDVLAEAGEALLKGNAFNEHFLMCVATLGALAVGFLPGAESQFPEAVFVMLFFQVGELFEDYAEGQSRRSIAQLMDIRPDTAHVVRKGQTLDVNPQEVAVGELLRVRPGEKIPLDGLVVEGTSSLNTTALTGESLPRRAEPGDSVASGCVNLSGVLTIKASKTFGESTASKIIELVENAGTHKARSENFITSFARIYTPAVVGAALLLAFLPPFFSDAYWPAFGTWATRALMFLVVSCPCALVLSVPLTFFGGIGGASRKGILIKGGNYIDALSRLHTVVFDKTGTLTRGRFEVAAVHPDSCDGKQLLHLAAHVERYSTHPIAQSLKAAYPDEADHCTVSDVEEVAGKGIRARVNGQEIWVGNTALMEAAGAQWRPCHKTGTIVHVAIGGAYAGHIVVADEVKADSAQAIDDLRRAGVQRTVMLTGDREEVGRDVATELRIDEYHAELLPADKVSHLERLLGSTPKGRSLAFVGDGINDAPVLARADVGIAMGGMGSDAAIEAADVVLMDDRPDKIALALRIARRTLAIARQNVVLAIGIKAAVLFLAAFGLATMWMAVFADVGVTVIAVCNAMRTLRN